MSSVDVSTPRTTEEFYEHVARVASAEGYKTPAFFALRVDDLILFSALRDKPGIYATLYQVLDLGSRWDEGVNKETSISMSYFEVKECLRLLDPFILEEGRHENVEMLLRAMYATSSSSRSASLVLIPHGVSPDAISDPKIRREFQTFLDSSSD